MIKAIVKMWGTKIGEVVQLDDGYCKFKYDDNFLNSNIQLSPIFMPLSKNEYIFRDLSYKTFLGLPGLLADSLPDKFGTSILADWLATQGKTIDDFGPVERLLYIGTRGLGALEYYPSYIKNETSTNIYLDRIVDLCNEILNSSEHLGTKEIDLRNLIKVGTSAGGARAKAIVAYNRNIDRFKSGQIDAGEGYDYYILKFDGITKNKDKDKVDSIYSTRIEYAYYLMAKNAGINMSHSELLIRDEKYHFMTKRFDRYIDSSGTMKKIHMQSLCAINHLPFDKTRIFGYEQAVQIMKKMNIGYSDIEQFFRRMVFNIIARNQDDHVKNISFLMDRTGKWSLSPAYDITYMYDPTGKWTNEHQMLVNGKSSNIDLDDIISTGKNMNISELKIKNIIEEVKNAVKKFEEFADEAFLPKEVIVEIKNNFELLD